jgi:hypothetical protein
LLKQANSYLKDYSGQQEIDFSNTDKLIREVLNNIISHKLVGIDLILGKIFDDIGFNQIQDECLEIWFCIVWFTPRVN